MNKYINRYVDLMFVVHDRRDSQDILWYYSFIKQNKEVLAKKRKTKQNRERKGESFRVRATAVTTTDLERSDRRS